MTITTALIIGFAAGFVTAMVTGKVLKFVIIAIILVTLGFLGYLRFFN